MAKMLCEAIKGSEGKLSWNEVEAKAFIDIKQALILVQVLALPDINKPFCLFVDEKSGVAKGVLTQTLGPWHYLMACLSTKPDPAMAGWPACLRITAAVALPVKDSDDLTVGQTLIIIAPHAVKSLLRSPPHPQFPKDG